MKNIKFFIFLFLFFSALLLLLSCSSKKEKTEEGSVSTILPEEINEVHAMRLEMTEFYHELTGNGTVSARQKADLRFQQSEVIAAIYVKNGDRVKKGQPIAMLDQFKLQNTFAQAKENLSRSRLDMQNAIIDQGYTLSDLEGNTVPADKMELARIKSNYNNSLIQYELAEYNLNHSALYAPFDGVVANLFSKVHNLPEGGQPFCTIIDYQHPEVVFKVLESELPYLRSGDKVRVSPFSANDFSCEGQIIEINLSIDKNGMTSVKAVIHNHQNQLYDGMNVKIHMQRALGQQLVIPKEALVLRTNKKVVFTLKNERAQWVYVETGLENSNSYVVTSGLQVGDSVIVEGNMHLADQTPIKLKTKN